MAVESFMQSMPLWGTLFAGFLFFFSPCSFPLYPTYLSHLTGLSIAHLQQRQRTDIRPLLAHSFCFILGTSALFYAMGLGASALGSWVDLFWADLRTPLRLLGGALLLVMGTLTMGIWRPLWWMRLQRGSWAERPIGYVSSFFIGLGFSASWIPCAFPMMASVFVLITQQPEKALLYTTLFCTGFGLPFLAGAFFIHRIRSLARYTVPVTKIGGCIMILFGLLLLADWLGKVTKLFNDLFHEGLFKLGLPSFFALLMVGLFVLILSWVLPLPRSTQVILRVIGGLFAFLGVVLLLNHIEDILSYFQGTA